ncbi:MAG: glycosyltransferase family 4 protein [Anaerolineae bacterium]|nr:glycosyltransferase family 4 protein [Anaerolineae bacterium]MDW8099855.1 glycosyltransferase family 4 protein [Anaerolineae bacterium]
MRILHIIQRYWPARGGAETHMEELSSRLAAEGCRVTIATTDAWDFELLWDPRRRRIVQREDEHRGVRILRFPVRHLPGSPLSYSAWRRGLWLLSALCPVPTSVLSRLARFTPWVPELWRWLHSTEEPFDLVAGMTICFEPLLEAGLRFAQRRGIPFVVYPLTHLGAGSKPGADALSRFYTMRHQVALVRASSGVVAQTPQERAFYLQHGIPEERIIVAGPGVSPSQVLGGDSQRFRRRYGIQGPLVACLSTLSYDKGSVHLVEAMRTLWRAGRQIHLALAGTVLGPFRRYLERLPQADRARLHVLGPVEDQEKRDLLAACDVFAMPSRADSFGIVYLEAWLYRKPVIGARAWGIADVIEDGKDGLLVPFGDVASLADAIVYLVDHPEAREAMGARGEEKVYRHHTWDHKYLQVRAFYQRLALQRKPESWR